MFVLQECGCERVPNTFAVVRCLTAVSAYFKGQGSRHSRAHRGWWPSSAFASASVPEDEEVNAKAIDRGLRYLQQFIPGRQFNQREIPPQHYYYGQYYAALAMWTAGGDYWRTWFPAVRDELLSRRCPSR